MNTARFVILIRTEIITEREKNALDAALEKFSRENALLIHSVALLQKVEGTL